MVQEFELYSVSKSFGENQILKEVSFKCSSGEVIGLFGRNGCGKSTLLKILFGLMPADDIEATVNKRPLVSSEVVKRKIFGYLPQHHFIPKSLKVHDAIIMFLTETEEQDRAFYEPGVAKFTKKKVGELSLGQLKYLECILIASGSQPFLLLDEPFSMIDPLQKDGIKNFLKKVRPNKGIIITDHYYDDVFQISTKNLVLKQGVSHIVESEEDLKKFNYIGKDT